MKGLAEIAPLQDYFRTFAGEGGDEISKIQILLQAS